MRIGSMYSGIGGMDLAVLAATEPHGRVVWHCESGPYPRAVLAERFPGVPCYESDEAIDETAAPIDCLIGGPPCQPSSLAGKRKGADDDRWRWPQFLRVVGLLRPSVIYMENPSALLTLDDGQAFHGILGALTEMGFDAEWTCVRASDVGAPHRRERLFILAYSRSDGARKLAASRQQSGRIARARSDVADASDERREWGSLDGPGGEANRAEDARADVADAGCGSLQRLRGNGFVVDAQGSSREQGRECDSRGDSARDSGALVADTMLDGQQGRSEAHDDDGYHAPWDEPDGCDSDVGDTGGERRREGDSNARSSGAGRAITRRDDSSELGDTDGARRERTWSWSHEERERSAERRGALAVGQIVACVRRDSDGLAGLLESHRWPAPPGPQFDFEPPRVTIEKERRRARLKALGNSCCPQQALAAWRELAARIVDR